MTNQQILSRLIKLAARSNGGASGGTVLQSDLLHQDALFCVQEDLAQLMSDIANDVKGGPALLARTFPRAFSTNDARYDHVECISCGQRYQRIDFRSAAHLSHCNAIAMREIAGRAK
jgi:hypothetical protein